MRLVLARHSTIEPVLLQRSCCLEKIGQCFTVEHPTSATHGPDELIRDECVPQCVVRIPPPSDFDERGTVDGALKADLIAKFIRNLMFEAFT